MFRELKNQYADAKLIEEYKLIIRNNHVCYDGDLEDLLYDLGIRPDINCSELYKAKQYTYNEDGILCNCEEGDYLETMVFIQDGKRFEVQAFAEECGCGLEYCLAIWNATEA